MKDKMILFLIRKRYGFSVYLNGTPIAEKKSVAESQSILKFNVDVHELKKIIKDFENVPKN